MLQFNFLNHSQGGERMQNTVESIRVGLDDFRQFMGVWIPPARWSARPSFAATEISRAVP